jgi:hypothetical protein
MKKIIVFAAVILFGISSCNDDTNSEQTYNEQTHYDTLVITGEQVWLRNYSTNRLSQAYEKFNERDYDIIVLGEYDKEISDYSEEIGSGTINGGKLSFTVNVPQKLLEWDKLKVLFNIITEGEGWNVTIDEDATKGTFIEILTDDEDEYALIKEGVSGTTSSISDETVLFIYVDSDCTITGSPRQDQLVMYTFNPFTLKLKRGWNTVWYKQTYTTSGRSSFFMDIKNPDLKWVLIPTVPTM